MSILAWIIIGFLAGWIASIIMGTDSRQGLLLDIVIGILGAFVGGLIMSIFGFGGVTQLNLYSLFVAIMGSSIVIWIGKKIA